MFRKFKASVEGRPTISTFQGETYSYTIFSKEWMIENIGQDGKRWPHSSVEKPMCTYSLARKRDKNDKVIYEMTYQTGQKATLRMDMWDRSKCKWMHGFYWVTEKWDKVKEQTVTWIIGLLLSIIGFILGAGLTYGCGYIKGLNAGKSSIQSTIPDQKK